MSSINQIFIFMYIWAHAHIFWYRSAMKYIFLHSPDLSMYISHFKLYPGIPTYM